MSSTFVLKEYKMSKDTTEIAKDGMTKSTTDGNVVTPSKVVEKTTLTTTTNAGGSLRWKDDVNLNKLGALWLSVLTIKKKISSITNRAMLEKTNKEAMFKTKEAFDLMLKLKTLDAFDLSKDFISKYMDTYTKAPDFILGINYITPVDQSRKVAVLYLQLYAAAKTTSTDTDITLAKDYNNLMSLTKSPEFSQYIIRKEFLNDHVPYVIE